MLYLFKQLPHTKKALEIEVSCPFTVFCEIHVNIKFISCRLFVQKEDEPVAKKKKTEGSTEIGML